MSLVGTFGITGTGTSTQYINATDKAYGTKVTSPAGDGNYCHSIEFYAPDSNVSQYYKCFITDAAYTILGVGDAVRNAGAAGWYRSRLQVPVALSASTTYVLFVIGAIAFDYRRDAGDVNQTVYDATNSYASPVNPSDCSNLGDYTISIKANYGTLDGNVYVATTGNDSTGDGTSGTPWKTVNYASLQMLPGDTCHIAAGTYEERATLTNLFGVAGHIITFTNDDAGTVLYSSATTDVWQNNNCDYLTVHGIDVTGAVYANGIGFYTTGGCDHVTLDDCYAYTCDSSGFFVGNYASPDAGTDTNIILNNCRTYDVGKHPDQEGISIVHVTGVEVKYCTVQTNNTGRVGIDFKNGCNNYSCHHCEVYNFNLAGIYVDSHGIACDNGALYDNYVHDPATAGFGIQVMDEDAVTNGNITNLSIYNNIVGAGCSRCLDIEEPNNAAAVYTFSAINNTFYHTGAQAVVYIVADKAHLLDCVIRNDIIMSTTNGIHSIQYANYGDADDGITIDHNHQYNSGGTFHASSVPNATEQADPLFVNAAGADFRVRATSPVKKTGSATGAPSTDYLDKTRPNPPSIGAYEPLIASGGHVPRLLAMGQL